jgi:hypothetical protein
MAKINEQTLIITVSQLVRDADEVETLLSPELIAQLEAVVTELAGNSTLVEIRQA